ncbi:hypothetical protein CAEBREN_05868 [Caenorhabditis brenneri]|uniref:Uncharacterized protein n=1 Tax=Caenorhabditis brenneri TaxID=135651 RepID=G0MJ52_CAEBE|nr:hypothetical protein CAEBREN_05868 [Caenorhabditis brenneri]
MRPHFSIAEKVNEKAEEMAITWQLRAIPERAAREMRRPQRPPPRCRLCEATHQTEAVSEELCNIRRRREAQSCIRYFPRYQQELSLVEYYFYVRYGIVLDRPYEPLVYFIKIRDEIDEINQDSLFPVELIQEEL